MRSRQLECFIRVCELGSITKAAATLNIAQPALGIQIKALEREFGVQLLDRNILGTTPTAAGLTFLTEAKFILRRLQDLKRTLREQVEGSPQLITLGISPSLSSILATRLLEKLRATMPRVTVTVVEELSHVLNDQIEAGELDLGLIYNAPPNHAYTQEPLLREILDLVTSTGSPYDLVEPIRLRDLADVELTMPSGRDVLRRLIEDEMNAAGLSPRITFPINSMPAMKAVIARGLACGILPASAVATEVEAGTLKVRKIVEPSLWRTLYLIRPKTGEPPDAVNGIAGVIKGLLHELCAEQPTFEPVAG
ncbi:MAG TPA: LysR family transcriptional regulator [Aliidongia sp.]|uniref:LysR family transcriptional regulator n=1 Tax=Aliidongia sp. TaxID=1914230 RepID=UPI002DDDA082|nr:LysR family transcriptional regulator [Aliidongia sp.]HEV2677372.1 LysR family transcriptional regulator [Aliidongia sp.]